MDNIIKEDILIANAFDEYMLYKRENGTYYIKYGLDFYEKHAKLLPEFNIYNIEPIEELSFEEFKDFLRDTLDYYGEDCICDKSFLELLN